MKIRSDFVSNSSSSSYVITTNSNYDTDKLIKDLSDNCKCEYWNNYEKMKKTIMNNVALFVGFLKTRDRIYDYDKNNSEYQTDKYYRESFDYYEYKLNSKEIDRWLSDRISWLNDEHTAIRFQEPEYVCRTVTTEVMKKLLEMKPEELFNYIIDKSNFKIQTSSYMINEDSLAITEKLLSIGKEFDFYHDYTIDSIRKFINDDKLKIYNIHINRDGDGCDDDCFRNESTNYTLLDGLDGINIIDCETY